jgi:signal transduction histidine kinase
MVQDLFSFLLNYKPKMKGLLTHFLSKYFLKSPVYHNLSKHQKFFIWLAFFLGTLTVGQNGFCQQQKIDSLITLLTSKEGGERCDLLYNISYELILKNDFDKSLVHSKEAESLAYQLGDSLRIVKAGKIKASALRRLERLTEAVEVYTTIIEIAKRNRYQDELKVLLNSLAITYTYLADYDRALQINFESLLLREKSGDKVGISMSLNNIGLIYFKIKNYEKALEFYNRSLQLKQEVADKSSLHSLNINIGLCYNQLQNFDLARKFINEGLNGCKPNCESEIVISGEFGLGVSYFGQKKYEEGKGHFEASLEISKNEGNKRFQAENLVYIGRINSHFREFEEAEKSFYTAEGIAHAAGYNQPLIDTYRELSNLYNTQQNFEQAAKYQSRYIKLKDSIYNEQLIENIAKIQTNYAQRENIKTIADNEAVIRQQRYLNVAIAIIAILAGLLILVLQRSNRVSKQVNAQLSEAQGTIQQQNKLLEIKNKDLDKEVEKKTADLERVNISLKQVNDELDNFIYKTSHDIRGPLASLKGMCNVALMDVQDDVALDYLRKLDATAERLNSILTRLLIINQINNSKLSVNPIDFNRIINDVILLEKKKGLPAKIEIRKHIANDSEIEIRSDKELVRIVLENLIDNAIKFYNDSDRVKSFVEINITSTTEGVKARVIDNGIGISESNPGKLFQMFFRASERSEIGGIGLYIVKTATAKIGGKVGLLTTPEGYTEFYVTFPVQPPNSDVWPPVQPV